MADKKNVTTLIFDLGKVLVDFDHGIAAAKLSEATGKSPQQLFELFFDSRLTRLFEEGKIEPKAFYGKIKSILHLKMAYEQFVGIWNGIFRVTDENREVYELAKRLKARYTLALLSNINSLHLEFIRDHLSVFDAFHHIFVSCELGFMKPHPRIYTKTLAALGVKPGEVFYTDDRPEFIEKARSMGLRAFTYTTPGQLRHDLARCGIELPPVL